MIADYLAGEPALRVGKRYGVSLDNVRYHVKKLGLWPGGRRELSLEKRFSNKVAKTQTCWLWTGAQFPNGYGSFALNQETILAHRYAYEQKFGPIPLGVHIHHECQNRLCVNPDHLELVTPKQHRAKHPRKTKSK